MSKIIGIDLGTSNTAAAVMAAARQEEHSAEKLRRDLRSAAADVRQYCGGCSSLENERAISPLLILISAFFNAGGIPKDTSNAFLYTGRSVAGVSIEYSSDSGIAYLSKELRIYIDGASLYLKSGWVENYNYTQTWNEMNQVFDRYFSLSEKLGHQMYNANYIGNVKKVPPTEWDDKSIAKLLLYFYEVRQIDTASAVSILKRLAWWSQWYYNWSEKFYTPEKEKELFKRIEELAKALP